MNFNLITFLYAVYIFCCCYTNASVLIRQSQKLQEQQQQQQQQQKQQNKIDDNKVASIISDNDNDNNNNKTPWELLEVLQATKQLRGFNGIWINDEEFYYVAESRKLRKYNVANQTDEIYIGSDFLDTYKNYASIQFSPDRTKILVRYDVQEIFRHSSLAKYDIYDLKTRKSTRLRNGKRLQYCLWAQRMNLVSYVYENNVYIYSIESDFAMPITTDGIMDIVYNGVTDWVYEEEVLSTTNAMWWSPDGYKLAIGIFNDANVQTYKYFKYGDVNSDDGYQYPKEVDLKYPKSGTHNPNVAVKVTYVSNINHDLESTIIHAPIDIVSDDHILQYVTWANDEELLIIWLNRRQNISTIQSCTVQGICHEVRRLTEPNGWIVLENDFKCLKFSNSCLFRYWIDNWYQVWNLDLMSGKNLWLSRGNFTTLNIYGYNEIDDVLYYQATLPYDSSSSHVFANEQCLTCNMVDHTGVSCQRAQASFSKNFTYYAMTCNGPNPTYTQLYETSTNRLINNWELNDNFRLKLSTKQRPIIRFMNVSLADGSTGIVKLQLPPNLDKKRKYPLLISVYGGPNSVRVSRDFSIGFDTYLTTKREIIYGQIDGRGTGNKGKKLLFTVNNNLGEYEVIDQLHVIKYLQEKLSYVDEKRIGIWGWSYGGYLTARTISHDSNNIIKCGISVAPVTSWLYYDSIYTERYMGLPTQQDNLENYMKSSVLRNVENFRTHDFLLIHGTADDNVHYQQSLLFAKVLQQKDILFEEMTYTDENHAIGNLLPHLYNTMDNFWLNCFNLNATKNHE